MEGHKGMGFDTPPSVLVLHTGLLSCPRLSKISSIWRPLLDVESPYLYCRLSPELPGVPGNEGRAFDVPATFSRLMNLSLLSKAFCLLQGKLGLRTPLSTPPLRLLLPLATTVPLNPCPLALMPLPLSVNFLRPNLLKPIVLLAATLATALANALP